MLTRSHAQEVWGKAEGESGIIRQAADMLCQGKSKEDIRAHLLSCGMSEEQAYLTYIAAKTLASDRVEARFFRGKVA